MLYLKKIMNFCKTSKISESEFERVAGLSKGQINKWKHGVRPGAKSLLKVADFLGVGLEELVREAPEAEPVTDAPYIPIVNSSETSGAQTRIVADSVPDPGNCFAMIMMDESMAPDFSKGDIVIVYADAEIVSGDIVTVSTPGEHVICRKVVLGKDSIILQPSNLAFDAVQYRTAEIEMLPVAITGKVIRQIRNYN